MASGVGIASRGPLYKNSIRAYKPLKGAPQNDTGIAVEWITLLTNGMTFLTGHYMGVRDLDLSRRSHQVELHQSDYWLSAPLRDPSSYASLRGTSLPQLAEESTYASLVPVASMPLPFMDLDYPWPQVCNRHVA